MKGNWHNLAIQSFDQASCQYEEAASLQKLFAQKLAKKCAQKPISPGIWVDLGSGTGLLANALEKRYANQSVIRIDSSELMLAQHPPDKSTQLHDLNTGLPEFEKAPQLIASSFALHWLEEPQQKLKEWFNSLAPGGWLAITLPIKGSFPEWYDAASRANVICTAIPFPSNHSLLKVINKNNIEFQQIEFYTQEAPKVTSLLKPMINLGAQTSPYPPLSISHWRKLQEAWSRNSHHLPTLTWSIQTLLAQK